ncbi:Transcriptional regulator, LysR family [hydrothermal vent metagenome]|uniref:Transcriptional regulator, LysR family n=1 Tax=hydrothermal vent metagenome TaxID=652676 RepID=A0A3B0RKU0_9ZZZZ
MNEKEKELDLNLLLVFEAVYSTGNISRAADMLDRSQPAVSNALSRLRDHLDDPLFVRSGKGVAPTPRARALIGSVREALGTIRKGISPETSFDPKTTRRHFSLILADPMEPLIMPPLIRLVQDGQISFELQPPQVMNIEEALIDGKSDMAVFLFPANLSALHCEPLCPVDLVMLARKDHPRVQGSITEQNMVEEGHIILSLSPGKLANSEKISIWKRGNRRNVCYINKLSSVASLVAGTDLIGLVPRLYANYLAQVLDVQILDLPTPITDQQFFMIWNKSNDNDSAHIWLRQQIRTLITQL